MGEHIKGSAFFIKAARRFLLAGKATGHYICSLEVKKLKTKSISIRQLIERFQENDQTFYWFKDHGLRQKFTKENKVGIAMLSTSSTLLYRIMTTASENAYIAIMAVKVVP